MQLSLAISAPITTSCFALKENLSLAKSRFILRSNVVRILPSGVTIIPNDLAGRMLLAFDLHEPYACHQLYRIFDDEYADIFGRKEVDCYRIIFLRKVLEIVEKKSCRH